MKASALKKSAQRSDADRAERIRDAARDHETDNDPASFERAFATVSRGVRKPKKAEAEKK